MRNFKSALSQQKKTLPDIFNANSFICFEMNSILEIVFCQIMLISNTQ